MPTTPQQSTKVASELDHINTAAKLLIQQLIMFVSVDTGSRGATTKTRTILSYFTAQGEHPNGTLSGSIFPPTSASASSTPFVTPSNSSVSNSNDASVIDLSTGSAGISPNTTNKSNQQKSSFQSNNAKTSASFSVPAAINPEIKKQLEMLRASKEQAENKVRTDRTYYRTFYPFLCAL